MPKALPRSLTGSLPAQDGPTEKHDEQLVAVHG